MPSFDSSHSKAFSKVWIFNQQNKSKDKNDFVLNVNNFERAMGYGKNQDKFIFGKNVESTA